MNWLALNWAEIVKWLSVTGAAVYAYLKGRSDGKQGAINKQLEDTLDAVQEAKEIDRKVADDAAHGVIDKRLSKFYIRKEGVVRRRKSNSE